MIDVTKDYDPRYVQVRRQRAAELLGISPSEFDRLRKSDPHCPKGFKHCEARNSPVMFRLSDIYEYSEKRIRAAKEAA